MSGPLEGDALLEALERTHPTRVNATRDKRITRRITRLMELQSTRRKFLDALKEIDAEIAALEAARA